MPLTLRDVMDLAGGSTFTWALTAIAKHIPEWPLTWGKTWEWARASAQEIANQRSPASYPIYPALRESVQPKQ